MITSIVIVLIIAALAASAALIYTQLWPVQTAAVPQVAPTQSLPADLATIRDLRSALETSQHQVATLQTILSAPTHQAPPTANANPSVQPTSPQEALSERDIATKIDIWRSIDKQLNSFNPVLIAGGSIIDGVYNHVQFNRAEFYTSIIQFRDAYQRAVNTLTRLRDAYPGYSDVYETLNPDIHTRLFRSIEAFRQVIDALPSPVPDDYENTVRPYSGALKRDLDVIREWQSTTHQTAVAKGKELAALEMPSPAQQAGNVYAPVKTADNPPSPPTAPKPVWSDEEIAIRSDIWQTIEGSYFRDLINAYNFCDVLQTQWNTIASNRPEYLQKLSNLRKQFVVSRDEFNKLRSEYSSYDDINAAIDPSFLSGILVAIDNLSAAITGMPSNLPDDYQITMRPVAGALRIEMNKVLDHINQLRLTIATKRSELLAMSRK
jgi:hypothetical protein